MRKPEQSPEPSIEEILASIRKIIADDGGQAQPVAQPRPIYASSGPNVTQHPFPSHDRQPRERDPYEAEPVEFQADDEILELTEDFMLEEEAGAASGADYAEPAGPQAAAQHQERYAGAAPSLAEELSMGAGLESVLSNVVAEVNRLSSAKSAEAPPGPGPGPDWPEPVAKAPRAVPPAPRLPARDDADAQNPGPAHARGTANAAERSGPRPVWSARRLEGDAPPPRARSTQFRTEKPAAVPPPPAEDQAVSGRDNWADGVQMPVPASGPAAPFPQSPREEPEPELPVPSDAAPQADIEKEKSFVGDMLTKVFGATAKKTEEAPPVETSGPQAKAEELARTTIADFAADKLRAPTLGEALHADKPFMDAITNSLAHALAENEAAHSEPLPDDLPEALLPPDADLAHFASPMNEPALRAVTAPPPKPRLHKAEPVIEPEELPRDEFDEPAPLEAAMFVHPRDEGLSRSVAVRQPAGAPVEAKPAIALALAGGLEESIKEMVKPLIVEWLNENLPRIVEKAVREELAGHLSLPNGASGERGPRR
ncbi:MULTISPECIES: DUF2497 domain-containing protein [Rhodomicrobium]|uniref:DUF2497 domain-containing protein n=1 Tax=Rhodomicrobium TaxID=1068 RepID=UPI000B4BB269|nr:MULTISPECIES: DUF2497 domain-containing protein [Rhodomicrobium]